jgi:hypothetical protein
MHLDHYWKATIPVDRVQNADIAFEEFIPGIFHVFLIFYFPEDAPVTLLPQQKGLKPVKTGTLAISIEGIPPKDGQYNFVDAYFERYLIAVRLLSKEQMTSWSVKKLKHPVSLYQMRLSTGELAQVMRRGLDLEEEKSFKLKYALFSNNCATNVLDLIDSVVKPDLDGYPIYYKYLYPLERSLPILGPLGTWHSLTSRNLVDTSTARSVF